jgi:hypothetical protein
MEIHDTVQTCHYQLAVRISNAALLHVYDLAVSCSRHAIRWHVQIRARYLVRSQ